MQTAIEVAIQVRHALWDTLELYDAIGRELVQLYIMVGLDTDPKVVDAAAERVTRLVRHLHDGEQAMSSVRELLQTLRTATVGQG